MDTANGVFRGRYTIRGVRRNLCTSRSRRRSALPDGPRRRRPRLPAPGSSSSPGMDMLRPNANTERRFAPRTRLASEWCMRLSHPKVRPMPSSLPMRTSTPAVVMPARHTSSPHTPARPGGRVRQRTLGSSRHAGRSCPGDRNDTFESDGPSSAISLASRPDQQNEASASRGGPATGMVKTGTIIFRGTAPLRSVPGWR